MAGFCLLKLNVTIKYDYEEIKLRNSIAHFPLEK